jgi:hypothetical protein
MVKHEFVAYRDDRSAEVEPIRFTDERWLDYVPFRMPGAITVRERLPAGAVAVLLNPTHTHTDIFLPIDADEEKIVGAIDGVRSIAEILQVAADNSDHTANRTDAHGFFERLWHYDQVVFNASK